MSDVNANINISINSQQALGQLRALQNQISTFNQSVVAGNVAAVQAQRDMTRNLTAQINATKGFTTSIANVESSVSRLGTAIDKNKLSLREYFRYGVAASGAMGKGMREHAEIMGLAGERVKRLQTQYIALEQAHNGYTRSLAVRPTHLFNADSAIAIQRQQIFNKLLGDGSTALVNWGKNTQWAGRQLMVGFTVPLTIFGGVAGKIFMDLEKQVVQFKRVYGDLNTPTSERNAMVEQVKGLAKEFTKYGIAVSDTVALAAKAAATGAQGEDLMAATTEATRLATLGQIDYQQALDATISLQTALGISSDELAGATNFLNAVENQTVTSLDDITSAIPLVAPVIKGLGGDVKDLAIFMTAMREGGISANEGANALKSGLASLINPTKGAKEQLEKVGINIDSILSKNKGDLRGLVTEFGEALGTLGKFERQQTLAKMFGKYQFARMGALFSNISKEGSQAARVMDLTAMSAKELGQIAEGELSQLEESVGVKFTAALEKLKLAIAPIGEAFLKIATPIIDFAAKIADAFNNLPDAAKTFITWGTAIGGVLIPTVIMLVGLLGNFAGNMLKIGAAIGRLMGKTTGLGHGFEYLSMEELDAMAAAASLEGQTNSLTGALNVQKGAVMNLAKAYGSYVAAAGAAAANLPQGFRGPVRRMATGGFVAGSGNKDSEPALLMPGEFVVNKKAAQSNAPLLMAMNEGKLKGYSEGDRLRGVASAAASHYAWASPANLAESIRDLGPAIDDLEVDVFDLSKIADDEYEVRKRNNVKLSEVAEQQGDLLAGGKAFAGTTMLADTERNAMYQAVGIEGEAFSVDELKRQADLAAARRTQVDEKYSSHIDDLISESDRWQTRMAGAADQTEVQIDYMREQTRSGLIAARMQDRSNGARMTAAQAESDSALELAEIDKLLARRRAEGATEAQLVREAEVAYRKALLSKINEVAAGPRGTGGGVLRDVATGRGRQSILRRVFSRGESGRSFAYGGWGAPKMLAALTRGSATGAGTASPSEITDDQGLDIAKGMEQGIRKGTPAVADAGEDMGRAAVQASGAAANKGASFNPEGWLIGGTSPYDPNGPKPARDPQSGRVLSNGVVVGGQQRKTFPADQDVDYRRTQQEVNESTGKKTKEMGDNLDETNKGLKGFGSKLMGGMFAMDGLVMGMSMMEGGVGEFAQKIMPAVFALQGIALMKPLLMTPVGAVVAAMAALGAGLWFLNNKMNDVRDAGIKMAKAMTVSAEEVKGFSEFYGTKDIGKRGQAKGLGTTEKQLTKSQEFLQTETGKTLSEGMAVAMEKMGKDTATKQLGTKLGEMVLRGVVSTNQAKGIAGALEQQFGVKGLSANIQGHLTDLIGTDGRNILKHPITLAVRLQEQNSGFVDALGAGVKDAVAYAVKAGTNDIPVPKADATAGDLNKWASQPFAFMANMDIPYLSDFYSNITGLMNEDWAAAIASANAYGTAIGPSLASAFDTSTAALKRYKDLQESIKNEKDPEKKAILIKNLKAEKKALEDLNKITKMNRHKAVAQYALASGSPKMQAEMLKSQGDALTKTYENSPMKPFVDAIMGRANNLEGYMKWNLQLDLQSGQLNPAAMEKIFQSWGDDGAAAKQMELIISTEGEQEANALMVELMGIPDDKLIKNIMVRYPTLNEKAQESLIAGLKEINALPDDIKKYVDVSNTDPVQLIRLANAVEKFDELPDKKKKSRNVKYWHENFDMVWAAAREFAALSPSQRKDYLVTYTVVFDERGGLSTLAYSLVKDTYGVAGGTNGGSVLSLPGVSNADAKNIGAGLVTDLLGDKNKGGDDGEKPPAGSVPPGGDSSGGGDKEDPLAKYKEMWRKIQEQLKMYTNLEKVMKKLKGKKKTLENALQNGAFGFNNSLVQNMRKAGLSESLISDLLSEGYKEAKKIFEVLKKRDKLAVANRGFLIGNAGKTVSDNRKAAREADAQIKASQRLVGINKEARESIVGDPEKAQQFNQLWIDADKGIAGADKRLQDFINSEVVAAEKAKALQNALDPEAILDESISLIDEAFSLLEDQINLTYDKLIDPLEDQITANEDLIQVYEKQVEAKQEQIDDQERLNSLDQQAIDGYNREIEMQNRKIEGLRREDEIRQRTADALQKELELMSRSEQTIRDAYQKRIEALDSVAKLNDRILQSQQDQLNIGKALSEGDVYAAAQAAAEMQRNSVQYAADQNRAALEQGMENQIGDLRTSGGMTRAQAEAQIQAIQDQSYQVSLQIRDIEDYIYNLKQTKILPLEDKIYERNLTIRDLQNEIYDINEDSIEPLEIKNKDLEDQIKSQERLRDLALEEMVIGEFTKAAWEQRKNELNLATTQAELNALALAGIEQKYKDIAAAARDAAVQISKIPGASAPAAATGSATGTSTSFASQAASMGIENPFGFAWNTGGRIMKYAAGSVVGAGGGDKVSAMLSPGEFVIRKAMVDKYGLPLFEDINQGSFSMPKYGGFGKQVAGVASGGKANIDATIAPVYNTYSVNVNASTNASPDDIANTVINKIRSIESMSVRRINGY